MVCRLVPADLYFATLTMNTQWLTDILNDSELFMPHGHCYLWIPSLLWLNVVSDVLIGAAYLGITVVLWGLVRRLHLPFGPVILAFGLFIALCGGTHFMDVWTVWHPDYWLAGMLKAATALASVATAISLLAVKPQIQRVTEAARLSEERRIQLESTNAQLAALYERLKDADAFKSRFFENISHELRTPLALIVGPARQLQAADNLTVPQQRSLQGICDNGALLLRQVDDLLDLARLQADHVTLDYAETDLVPWGKALMAQFATVASQRGIDLRYEAPPTLAAQVDPTLLTRAFTNLLSNAIKFTQQGGSVLATLAVSLDRAVLSVDDSGPGIPIQQRERIFDRFNRGDESMRQRAGGTGLGLAIARDFVERMGGQLTVADAAGGGARFVMDIPLQAPASASIGATSPSGDAQIAIDGMLVELARPLATPQGIQGLTDASAPRVLIVEDNVAMRAFVADVLGSSFGITMAVDGIEGLAMAESLRPDLVVTDLAMPEMGGENLVMAMRQNPALDSIPILTLTARADDEIRVRLLRNGAQDFLVKPFLPDELKARVANLVSAKRAGDTLRATLSSMSGDLESMAREITVKNRYLANTLAAAEVARDQAERASLVKSSILGLLSHEIRTPLAAILMNLELLLRGSSDQLAASVRMKIDRITVAARQLNALMEGLLEYTRFEKEGIDPKLESIDPLKVGREIIDEYSLVMQGSSIALRLIEPEQCLRSLRTDSRLLKVMLSNLVSNAIKFTPAGEVTLAVSDRDEHCIFAVKDTGAGIPKAALARIFMPFEQLEPLQRKSVGGVGLGLALVRQIAQSLRGRIDVESEVGVGSTFRVVLPFGNNNS